MAGDVVEVAVLSELVSLLVLDEDLSGVTGVVLPWCLKDDRWMLLLGLWPPEPCPADIAGRLVLLGGGGLVPGVTAAVVGRVVTGMLRLLRTNII